MKHKFAERLAYLQGTKSGNAIADNPRHNAANESRHDEFVRNAKRQIQEALAKRERSEIAAPKVFSSAIQFTEISLTFPAAIAGPVKKPVVF